MSQDTPNTPDFERRLTALEKGQKDLDDAMLVHAHLEARAARRIKEHSEFLADHQLVLQHHQEIIVQHQQFLTKHQQFLEQHEQIMGELDMKMREIGGKVDFLIDRDMKREGGPEAH
ncbi:MAG: hypothetical protein JO182_04345 [Acidobacteriaceae bacterium]|nr:hypothetical protein [Acidobacteriaceae bacterium]MBV9033703.1 hypothetical protein [Acidobacteriaceae bacterium]MBV9225584.1 hypothetical protein [Acidobacteriaceae bacterium]MBV9307900.1 hypothetical protein [Acidobacteriaceae bacterium]